MRLSYGVGEEVGGCTIRLICCQCNHAVCFCGPCVTCFFINIYERRVYVYAFVRDVRFKF